MPSRRCSIYVHDPGAQYNTVPTHLPGQLWASGDHYAGVARWIHEALLQSSAGGGVRLASTPEAADVVFVAHYFLTHNHKDNPLIFGGALFDWDGVLQRGGPSALLGNGTLLRRWQQRSSDFVVAPVMLACKYAEAAPWLRDARWIVLDPFFHNSCGYRQRFDVIAPYVVSDSAWAPPRHHWEGVVSSPALGVRRTFVLYAGRLGRAYLDPPMTQLRYRVWSVLRRHPNATILATDVADAVAPFAAYPEERCGACSARCQHCLDISPDADFRLGTISRVGTAEQYRTLLAQSTFCLVLRGDTAGACVHACMRACVHACMRARKW